MLAARRVGMPRGAGVVPTPGPGGDRKRRGDSAVTVQTALLVAVIGFVGGLGGMAVTQLWQDGRSRRAQRFRDADERRRRLRPSLERLLRSVIRFERQVSAWSPSWRPTLSESARERTRELVDELAADAEMTEVVLRLEEAFDAQRTVRTLRERAVAMSHLLQRPPGPGTFE